MAWAAQRLCVAGTGRRTSSCAVLRGSAMEPGVPTPPEQLVEYVNVQSSACSHCQLARGSELLAGLKTRTSLDEAQPSTFGWLLRLEKVSIMAKRGTFG